MHTSTTTTVICGPGASVTLKQTVTETPTTSTDSDWLDVLFAILAVWLLLDIFDDC
jgi:hypothetical protein